MTKDSVSETNLVLSKVDQLKEQFPNFPEINIEENGDRIDILLSTDNIDYFDDPKFQNNNGINDKKLDEIGRKIASQYPNCNYEGAGIGAKDVETKKGLLISISLSKTTGQLTPPSTSANIVSK